MSMTMIGDPKVDRFWIEIDKHAGYWMYTLRTKSGFGDGMPRGAEVAKFNSHYIAQHDVEPYLQEILTKLNA